MPQNPCFWGISNIVSTQFINTPYFLVQYQYFQKNHSKYLFENYSANLYMAYRIHTPLYQYHGQYQKKYSEKRHKSTVVKQCGKKFDVIKRNSKMVGERVVSIDFFQWSVRP